MTRLILASASPRRRELLGRLGLPFEVLPADVTEHEDVTTDPRVMVSRNAALKAEWVAARHPDAIVLGADTTVFIDGLSLNKPRDAAEARAFLAQFDHALNKKTAPRPASAASSPPRLVLRRAFRLFHLPIEALRAASPAMQVGSALFGLFFAASLVMGMLQTLLLRVSRQQLVTLDVANESVVIDSDRRA